MAKNTKTCGNCHILIFDEYKESFHGIAMGYGYEAVANCSSCHGVHNILPAESPLSKVNPANLAETCGQESCHPGMPEKIASSKIHIDVGQKKIWCSLLYSADITLDCLHHSYNHSYLVCTRIH